MTEAGVMPADIVVYGLHDCFSTNGSTLLHAPSLRLPKTSELVRRADGKTDER